jgi:hypothetical protein
MATIAELAQRERDLMAELAAVRVEISERAGQVDPEPVTATDKTAVKTAAKK